MMMALEIVTIVVPLAYLLWVATLVELGLGDDAAASSR